MSKEEAKDAGITGFEYDDATLESLKNPKKDSDDTDTKDESVDDEAYDDYDEDTEDEEKLDPIKQEAIAQGWNPNKDEWDGDPEDWVGAKEFIERGKLMSRISEESKQRKKVEKKLQQVEQALQALGEHNKKIAEKERTKLLEELKEERLTAIDEDDHRAAAEIADKIDEVKAMEVEEPDLNFDEDDDDSDETPQQREYSQEELTTLQSWIDKNSWFTSNAAMNGAADALSRRFAANNPDGNVEDMLAYVDKEIRKEFPHKFKKQLKGSAVTEPTGRGVAKKRKAGAKSKYSASDMSEEQMDIARTYERMGIMTRQEYANQLAEMGELPGQKGE